MSPRKMRSQRVTDTHSKHISRNIRKKKKPMEKKKRHKNICIQYIKIIISHFIPFDKVAVCCAVYTR